MHACIIYIAYGAGAAERLLAGALEYKAHKRLSCLAFNCLHQPNCRNTASSESRPMA